MGQVRALSSTGWLAHFQTTPTVGTSPIKTDYISSTAISSHSIERNKTEQTLLFLIKSNLEGGIRTNFLLGKNLCVVNVSFI